MGFAYRCDKCNQLTENQIVLCPSCAPKTIEAGQPDAQQLKPKMPSYDDFVATFPSLTLIRVDIYDWFQARLFGH